MAPIKILVRLAHIKGVTKKIKAIAVKKFKKSPGLPKLVPFVSNPEMVICSETTMLQGKKEHIRITKHARIPMY